MAPAEHPVRCDVCQRSPSSRLAFHCTSCARDAIYESRLQLTEILLETERLEQQITATVKSTHDPATATASSLGEPHKLKWARDYAISEREAAEHRTQEFLQQSSTLRSEIQQAREDLKTRRAQMAQRRLALKSAQDKLSSSGPAAVQVRQEAIRRYHQRWDHLHDKTVEAHVLLVQEAASLFGITRHGPREGEVGKETFCIGDVPIVDLRDLNGTAPAVITNSTTRVASLVHLISHYLSLRLPAEITLPHHDYPLPTIFSPASSYFTDRPIPSPGTTISHAQASNPSASRHQVQQLSQTGRSLPRPRVLHLDKPLSMLYKEDQIAYSNFVEGIVFLAWDVAWLCRTQGLPTGATHWEDVCDMGKNLFHLAKLAILSQESKADRLGAAMVAKGNAADRRTGKDGSASANPPPAGHLSHDSSYAFLPTAAGAEYMRTWQLNFPVKVVDKVKAFLLNERTGAEWEVLEGRDWDGDTQNEQHSRHEANAKTMRQAEYDDKGREPKGLLSAQKTKSPRGNVSADPRARDGGLEERRIERAGTGAGENGWTKLKPRAPPVKVEQTK